MVQISWSCSSWFESLTNTYVSRNSSGTGAWVTKWWRSLTSSDKPDTTDMSLGQMFHRSVYLTFNSSNNFGCQDIAEKLLKNDKKHRPINQTRILSSTNWEKFKNLCCILLIKVQKVFSFFYIHVLLSGFLVYVYELCYINPQYIYFKIKDLFVIESIFRADYDSIISLPCVNIQVCCYTWEDQS